MPITMKEIIKKYLEDNEYDGLFYDDCGCFLDDLIPCAENFACCKPGYAGACNCGAACGHHIYSNKADALAANAEKDAANADNDLNP